MAQGVSGGAPRALVPQAVGLGDTGRVSNAKKANEIRRAGGAPSDAEVTKSMLDDDAGHLLFARLADDGVVVAVEPSG